MLFSFISIALRRFDFILQYSSGLRTFTVAYYPEKMALNLQERTLKVTVVGDGCVGKTCLLVSYVHKEFPTTHVPTVFDISEMSGKIVTGNTAYRLTLWDTAGQEQYDKLRILSYPNTDVIVLCYAVDQDASFANILHRWSPELQAHIPDAPVVLVGTKIDKRSSDTPSSSKMISTQQGKKLQKKIKAAAFIECSALTRENLDEVFSLVTRVVDPSFKKSSGCNIL